MPQLSVDDYLHSPVGVEFDRRYATAWSACEVDHITTVIESRWARTHVTVTGDPGADPIVLLPGAGATSAAWARAMGCLTRTGHRVIAPDLPGDPGLSVRYASLAALPDLYAWLDDLLTQMEADSAGIVGHSYGAMVATGYVLTHPDRNAKLILLEPNSVFAPISVRAAIRAAPLLARPSARRLRAFYEWESRGAAFDPGWIQLVEYAADSFPARRPLVPRRLDVTRLNALGRSVSVLLAENSRYHDAGKVRTRILNALPDADVTTIGASHHMLPLQPAAKVNNAILAALGG